VAAPPLDRSPRRVSDEEMLKKSKLPPFGLSVGGGSIAEEQPQLHLQCKQMILPDISTAIQQLNSSDPDHFSDQVGQLCCSIAVAYAFELGDFKFCTQIMSFYLFVRPDRRAVIRFLFRRCIRMV
jgi:hypothetical protein